MKTWITTLAIALAGCTVNPPVKDIGGGRYTVSDSSIKGEAAARADVLEQAASFCSPRKPKVENFEDHVFSSFWGTPTSSIVFRCE